MKRYPVPNKIDTAFRGYLYRKKVNGKVHIVANGQALCRIPYRPVRYLLSADAPDDDGRLCLNCLLLQEVDPDNQRQTLANGRVGRPGS